MNYFILCKFDWIAHRNCVMFLTHHIRVNTVSIIGKKKKRRYRKTIGTCVDRLMNDFFNTVHQSATCVSHNVAECIVYRQWCIDGSMGMNIYWLAKLPLGIASIYGRIPAATPNMLVLPASMQQIVLFSGPRATSQVHPRIVVLFNFHSRYG